QRRPLTPNPSPQRGEGSKNDSGAFLAVDLACLEEDLPLTFGEVLLADQRHLLEHGVELGLQVLIEVRAGRGGDADRGGSRRLVLVVNAQLRPGPSLPPTLEVRPEV